MPKPKFRYKKRAFLNADNESSAHIIANVRIGSKYTSPELVIADCNRKISLDFDFGSEEKDYKKVEKKLELFVGIINDWAKAMRDELAHRRGGTVKLVDDDY